MKTVDSFRKSTSESKTTLECRIVAAYEDKSTRTRAMALIGHLEKRFGDEIDFTCTWWKFRFLMDKDIALVARHYAESADVMIFASDAPGLFPLQIMNWVESWTERRSRDGGVLVPLIGSPYIPQKLYSTKRFYLRHVADRAGLDYLTQSMLVSDQSVVPIPTRPTDRDLSGIGHHQPDSSRTSISSE